MPAPETNEDMSRRLAATMELGASEDASTRLLPHLHWELGELMRRVGPGDLEPSELLAILGVLAAAHSRLIVARGPISPRRPLWIVPGG